VTALAIPALGQPTGYECGNTCLAAVAAFFGRPGDIAAFGTLARTTSVGTDHANMIEAAIASGATVESGARGTIDELEAWLARGVPPIVGWWSMGTGDAHWRRRNRRSRRKKDCGHYSVVQEVTATEVVLMDPQAGPDRHPWSDHRLDRRTFERVWYDTDTSRYVKVERWWMAMRFEGGKARR